MAAELTSAIDLLRTLGFSYFFIPLLIAVILFGILSKTKIISDRVDVNAIVSFVIAFILALYKPFISYIELLVPFLLILVIFGFFFLVLLLFLGASMEDVTKAMRNPVVAILLIIILMIIFYSAAVFTFPELWPSGYYEYYNISNATNISGLPPPFIEVRETLSNPTVLALIGFLILVAVAAYAVTYKK